MASKTDIANLAIAAHSGDWVEDIESAPGRTPESIRALWAIVLEEALAAHLWKFCKKAWRDQPSVPAADNPDPDLGYGYRLPPDCVRVFELRPETDFDEWEGMISSDAGPTVTMIGTRRGVDIGRFSAFFNVYLAALLALRICTAVNASEAIRTRCTKERDIALENAKADNGKAGRVKTYRPNSFLVARMGGARVR